MFRNPLFVNPSEDECGICHSYIEPGDNYCRNCGTKVGGKFDPYVNVMETLYGPPPEETKHECIYCGNCWSSWSRDLNNKRNYCPVCGKKEAKQ